MGGVMHGDPSDPEEALAIAEHFHGEWYNGGLSQFFANWEPEDAALVPAALRAIGFSRGGGIVDRAIAAMGAQAGWQEAGLRALTDKEPQIKDVLYALDRELGELESAFDKTIVDFEYKHAKKSGEEMFE